jgi:excisionase family DNA binding protein
MEPRDRTNSNEKSLNLIWGAEAIAEALGVSVRKTFHLLESGHLPATKIGGRWVVARERLRTFFLGGEAM